MKIIGLTGSIAAGKSTIVGWINELGIAVHESDCTVHELLGPNGEAVHDVLAEFGSHFGTIADGIKRKLLGDEIFSSSQKRLALESILHPLIRQRRDAFIAEQRKANAVAIVLDVPLLFETGGEVMCDYVIVAHASAKTIFNRALARPGMTTSKLTSILASQMPSDDKKARADLVLDTDIPKDQTRNQLIDWLSVIGVSIVGNELG
jgi:dephospho-CoA kinase